ncbi:MAG TPA: alcohol dehydrogenase catalytic domain-containing protein [Candidatus Limnocylindrales bacterium]
MTAPGESDGDRRGAGAGRRTDRSRTPESPGVLDAVGVVFLGPGAMEIVPYRVDPPGPGEVRVRMAASGVCHSDLHVLDGDWTRPAPTVMGHEGAGWVESVGPDAAPGPGGAARPGADRRPRIGDFVVLAWTAPCRRCASCRRGEGWLCLTPAGSGHRRAPGDVRIRRPDEAALGAYSGIGTLGSVQVVAADAAIPVDPRTDPAIAALIGCAITTGIGAVTRTARVEPGQTVAVIGLGGVGLAAVLGARLAGASRIVAIDRNAAKLDRAVELGASDVVVAAASPAATATAVRALLADRPHAAGSSHDTAGAVTGVDHAFETSGTVAGVETGLAAVRPGGTTVLVGMPPQGARAGLDVYAFVESGARILASSYGSAVPAEIFPEIAGYAVEGSLPLERLIEERIGLADVPSAFDALRRGEGARRVVIYRAS